MSKTESRIRSRVNAAQGDIFAAMLQRLQYFCDMYYNGSAYSMANDLKVEGSGLYRVLSGRRVPQVFFLTQILRTGLINAEWLICGTGPMFRVLPEPPRALNMPHVLHTPCPTFDTTGVQCQAQSKSPAKKPALIAPVQEQAACWPLARAIHAARVAHKPVLAYLDGAAVLDGGGPAVAAMLRKGYVTAVACSSAAAQYDLAYVVNGNMRSAAFDSQLAVLRNAAYTAAADGAGYGETLGRLGYPPNARREHSFISTAYELRCPATVHVSFGEATYHFYPSVGGAEFGAAIGAASYADLLVFTEQVRQTGGTPSGVFFSAADDTSGERLFANAHAALATNQKTRIGPVPVARLSAKPQENVSHKDGREDLFFISGEYRLTLPALLAACDAVYDGSADDARSSRRTKSCRIKRNR